VIAQGDEFRSFRKVSRALKTLALHPRRVGAGCGRQVSDFAKEAAENSIAQIEAIKTQTGEFTTQVRAPAAWQ
jgi:hypothetical protein